MYVHTHLQTHLAYFPPQGRCGGQSQIPCPAGTAPWSPPPSTAPRRACHWRKLFAGVAGTHLTQNIMSDERNVQTAQEEVPALNTSDCVCEDTQTCTHLLLRCSESCPLRRDRLALRLNSPWPRDNSGEDRTTRHSRDEDSWPLVGVGSIHLWPLPGRRSTAPHTDQQPVSQFACATLCSLLQTGSGRAPSARGGTCHVCVCVLVCRACSTYGCMDMCNSLRTGRLQAVEGKKTDWPLLHTQRLPAPNIEHCVH